MIQEETDLVVADNTGARRVRCFRVLGQRNLVARTGKVAVPAGRLERHQRSQRR